MNKLVTKLYYVTRQKEKIFEKTLTFFGWKTVHRFTLFLRDSGSLVYLFLFNVFLRRAAAARDSRDILPGQRIF